MAMLVGDRIQMDVTLVGDFTFSKWFGWKEVETHIYKLEDAEGRVFVWKTTASLGMDSTDKRGNWVFDAVSRNDACTIKATIKGVGEYKGEKQIELQRVKVLSIVHAPTREEIRENKRKAQLEAMQEGDILYTTTYAQAKEHYADCEILAGSYDKRWRTIQVIVPKGRMVNSGVRFKKFSRYVLCPPAYANVERSADLPVYAVYRAVDEEHALLHHRKEHPEDADWVCYTVN